ncbi:FG-GAP repeat domain-containing protein [Singulisphaera rosea]
MRKSAILTALFLLTTAPLVHSQTARSILAAEPRSFERVLLLESKGESSAGVSLGDIDGDGDLDVILAKGRHWPLLDLVLRNDGKGRFATENLSETADRTYSAALADIDGDGDLDIVVSNDKPDKKLIYKNNDKGQYVLSGTFGDPNWSTRYITLADVNGDNRPDILVANRGSIPDDPCPSYLCLNDGRGAFPSSSPLPTESATIIVAKDFDGDGSVDLLVPHRDGGQSLVFWNDGKANFAESTPFGPAHSSIRSAASADLNGDGTFDVVIGDEKEGVFFSLNEGHRRFGAPIRVAPKSITPYAIGLADLNKDKNVDIIVGNVEFPGSIFFNKPKDREIHLEEIHWGDGKGTVYEIAAGDLDGDGWPDIAAARSDAPNAVWFSDPGRK